MIPQIDATKIGIKLCVLAAALLVLLGAGFAGGCRWQKGEVAEAEAKQHDAERERDGWRDVAGKWENAIKAQRLTARFIHNGNLANNVVLAFGFDWCSFKFSRYG